MIIRYTVLEIWQVMDVNVVFHFVQFFPLTSVTVQKRKISKKMKKTPGDIIILHVFTKNYD